MYHRSQLISMPEEELARVDVAESNLACAMDLPRTHNIDWDSYRHLLNAWTRGCNKFTNGVLPHFYMGKSDYPDSVAKFRIQAMITHLQRDLGVRFRPECMADDSRYEHEDAFVHGIFQGRGGTCGSLPVIYASVGRRLGYPIKLRTTTNHLYCSWDTGPKGENFNIEASGQGVNFYADEHYRTGRYNMPYETIRDCGLLKSLSPREELASFMCQRGECWLQDKRYREAIDSYAWANELDPTRKQYEFMIRQLIPVWDREILKRVPPMFPALDLSYKVNRFKKLPQVLLSKYIGMMVTTDLLDHPQLDAKWWQPLRRNPRLVPNNMPSVIPIRFAWDEKDMKKVTIHFLEKLHV